MMNLLQEKLSSKNEKWIDYINSLCTSPVPSNLEFNNPEIVMELLQLISHYDNKIVFPGGETYRLICPLDSPGEEGYYAIFVRVDTTLQKYFLIRPKSIHLYTQKRQSELRLSKSYEKIYFELEIFPVTPVFIDDNENIYMEPIDMLNLEAFNNDGLKSECAKYEGNPVPTSWTFIQFLRGSFLITSTELICLSVNDLQN